MSLKQGSILGGILLIAGSCIGAGMLALPILTGIAGFFPSLFLFFCAWLFMTFTGLLLVEMNSWFATPVNLISMMGQVLGKVGKAVSWVLYLFLFYSLLVAYISGSGSLFSTFLEQGVELNLPEWAGSLFFVIAFGWLVYLGTRPVDWTNRVLMFAKIIAFLGLVFLGVQYVRPSFLLRTQSSYAIFSLPLLITSFGFHNMIPSLHTYMQGNVKRMRITILGGSLFVLLIYIVWEVIVLGILPLEGQFGIKNSLREGQEASQAIAGILGSSWVSRCAQALAFFAILTSFLAQSLSLVHFLGDGLKVTYKRKENIALCFLALLPPLLFSLLYPQLFFKALNFAGGVCAVILFGILPICAVWRGRYIQTISSSYQLFGGKGSLCIAFLFALFVFLFQLATMLFPVYFSMKAL